MLSLKGEKRCGESAAGFWAMQVINTAILCVQDALRGLNSPSKKKSRGARFIRLLELPGFAA